MIFCLSDPTANKDNYRSKYVYVNIKSNSRPKHFKYMYSLLLSGNLATDNGSEQNYLHFSIRAKIYITKL